jgi:nitrogen-specific signal transduction histidine kinase
MMGTHFFRVVLSGSSRPDLLWACVTLVLGALVAVGYAVIAFNWYFQTKVRSRQARGAIRRLVLISLACAVYGGVSHTLDLGWIYLRFCDLAVAGIAIYTWSFALRMHGVSMVERRLAEIDELEERAARYREIAQLLPHLVWTATTDGQIDFSNRRWFDYAGNSRHWLAAVHPDDQKRVNRWWQQAHRAVRAVTIEARLCGACGVCRTFVISATPIAHCGRVMWLGACADIEDQKQLATEREEQARQKSFFLSALSHDLRTPLNAIVLHAELLRDSVAGDEAVESARAIMESATAASELINCLLDFAKAGSLDRNELDDVRLEPLLRQIHQRYLPLAERRGLYLRLHPHADAHLRTDRQKVQRIVGNLIENAIKYTPRGGVTVSVEQSAEVVVIRVRDTGIGIPREKAANLFDEFYQVENEERDRRKGFGLGLAICRSLARQIGGDVRLASSDADGSCFECVIRSGGRSDAPRPEEEAIASLDVLNVDRVEGQPA